jgi:hypothetical protein
MYQIQLNYMEGGSVMGRDSEKERDSETGRDSVMV